MSPFFATTMAGDDPQKGVITGDGSVGSSSTKGVVSFPTRLSDEKLEGTLNFQIWQKTILVCLKGMGKAKYLTDLPPESTDPNCLSWEIEENRIFGLLLNSMDCKVKVMMLIVQQFEMCGIV